MIVLFNYSIEDSNVTLQEYSVNRSQFPPQGNTRDIIGAEVTHTQTVRVAPDVTMFGSIRN